MDAVAPSAMTEASSHHPDVTLTPLPVKNSSFHIINKLAVTTLYPVPIYQIQNKHVNKKTEGFHLRSKMHT